MNPRFISLQPPLCGYLRSKKPMVTDSEHKVWTASLPYYQSKPGGKIHRVVSGCNYFGWDWAKSKIDFTHAAASFACGNSGFLDGTKHKAARLLGADELPENAPICIFCQIRKAAKLPDPKSSC